MKFLAIEIELRKSDSNENSLLLKEEAKVVFELKSIGIIEEIYFNENHCAVIILECKNKLEAESQLSKLPLVKSGYISFNIMQLNPYTGFDRLNQND